MTIAGQFYNQTPPIFLLSLISFLYPSSSFSRMSYLHVFAHIQTELDYVTNETLFRVCRLWLEHRVVLPLTITTLRFNTTDPLVHPTSNYYYSSV